MASDRGTVVRDVVRRHLPEVAVETVEALGTGLDNAAYQVNGALVVRFSTEPDSVVRAGVLAREAELLELVSRVSPLPIPVPRFVDPDAGCLGYHTLPGTPLLELAPPVVAPHAERLAGVLGEFLSALHELAPDELAALVDQDDPPPREWLDDAAAHHARVADEIPPRRRPAVRRFLAAEPPGGRYQPVFSHNDLGIEHVLVDPETWRVTGVIDWTDAAIADPAVDFGKLFRDLGPVALGAALRHYRRGAPAGLAERAAFYARCTVFEDLDHGLATNQRGYVEKCLTSLAWLFAG